MFSNSLATMEFPPLPRLPTLPPRMLTFLELVTVLRHLSMANLALALSGQVTLMDKTSASTMRFQKMA
jgi:hypothetical protein